MMGQQLPPHAKLFYYGLCLEERIPPDHLPAGGSGLHLSFNGVPIGIRGEVSRMRMRTCATMEREGMRVVAHGAKWCRPQPVSRKNVPLVADSGPSVFEQRFWLFAGGIVFLWVCLRVFDFTLLPPAYNGLLLTQPFCGLHSWDLADRAWAARSHLKYGLGGSGGQVFICHLTGMAGDSVKLWE